MKKFILSVAAFFARILPVPVKKAIYKMGPVARFVRSSLNKASPVGLSEVEIAAGGLAGMPMLLNMQDEKDFWLGTYEPEMEKALEDLLKLGMTAYDVGANIGYVSLLLAKAVGVEGRVFSFEALPSNVERLTRNMELNGMQERVMINPVAVTSGSGVVKFLVHASGGMGKAAGSAGRAEKYINEISVPGISLDCPAGSQNGY
jgi:FkbM family methyltransferase